MRFYHRSQKSFPPPSIATQLTSSTEHKKKSFTFVLKKNLFMQCSQKLILFNVFLFLPHFSFYCFYFSLSPWTLLSNRLYCCVYCLSYLLFRPLFPFKYINNKLQTLCIAYDYNNYDCYYYYFIFSSLTVIIVWNDFEWIMQISLSF